MEPNFRIIFIGGSRGACPAHTPPWDRILSFSHTFSPKSAHVGGPCPPNGCTPPLWEILDLPLIFDFSFKLNFRIRFDLWYKSYQKFSCFVWFTLSVLSIPQEKRYLVKREIRTIDIDLYVKSTSTKHNNHKCMKQHCLVDLEYSNCHLSDFRI